MKKTILLFSVCLLGMTFANALAGSANAVGSQGVGDTVATDGGCEIETFTVKGVTFEMVRVDGGSFMMGSYEGSSDEQPVHSETVSTFYIGRTEVTQALWTAVMGYNPSYFRGESLPVDNVNWYDCHVFVVFLSRLTGREFRLPTEAEWEYAARGGNKSRQYEYSGSNDLDRVGWYSENSGTTSHAVGSKLPNELGIYDMSGNVWELTSDLYSSNYSSDRNGGSSGSDHVNRGGCWSHPSMFCRSTYRGSASSSRHFINNGLRLAL